jgi:sodium pump decarboxylase gamma subunit
VDNIQTGLMVSIVGLSVTFLALLIFIGVIVVLKKLFPSKSEQKKNMQIEGGESAEPVVTITTDESDSDEEIVAALAAIAYTRARQSNQLGAALLAGPGPFRTSR